MTTFLHAADIHLDGPLTGLSRYEGHFADVVRQAPRRALENLVDHAVTEQIPLVLIAGDIYDGQWRDYQTGQFFAQQMARLAAHDIRVALIHGNHDAQSVISKSVPLPDNVYTFPAHAPETKTYDDLGIAVHGQSYSRPDIRENLAEAYPAPVNGLFNIGLLHTAVAGAEGHKPYAPCSLEQLQARGYDYWALGHVHSNSVLSTAPAIAFSGAIQGRNIRETGPKGCLRVDGDSGGVRTTFCALDTMRWESLEVDATDAPTPEELLRRFHDLLDKALDDAQGRHLAVRASFTGQCPAHVEINANPHQFEADIRTSASTRSHGLAMVEKLQLRTSTPVDLDALAAEDSPVGDLLRLLRDLSNDPAALGELQFSLDDLKAKLPPAITGDLPRTDTAQDLAPLLADVREILLPLILDAHAGEDA